MYYGANVTAAHALTGLHAIVVGGGNSAGQAALHLARYCERVTIVVRSESLTESMSAYLVGAIDVDPRVEVRTTTEVTAGEGDGQLERVVLRNRSTGEQETLRADGMFVMIGAEPRTDWLPAAVERDKHGFVLTGADAAGHGWVSSGSRTPTRRRCPACSPSVTCAAGRSSGWRRPSARGRSSCRSCTSTSPPSAMTEPATPSARHRRWPPPRPWPFRWPDCSWCCRQPRLDLQWEHHPSHFWLVLGTAAVSSVLAYATGVAAVRRGDARVLFVSLAFLSSAGFLGLHALATPGVLLAAPNQGFAVATPVGLALGSLMAAWSTVDLTGSGPSRRSGSAGGSASRSSG